MFDKFKKDKFGSTVKIGVGNIIKNNMIKLPVIPYYLTILTTNRNRIYEIRLHTLWFKR